MNPVRRRAPAKINLGLRIGKKRPDGYHRLRTVYQSVTLSDTVTLRTGGADDRLTIDGPVDLKPDDENLVLRAVQFVREHVFDLPPLRLHLEKAVPVKAGLGGGSSDAAAVLRAILEPAGFDPLAETNPGRLARELGADVPFFLHGGTVFARGIGERLTPLKDLEAYVVIGVPPIEVSTPWAFGELEEMSDFDSLSGLWSPESGPVPSWRSLDLTNDFRDLLEHHFPLYADLFSTLSHHTNYYSITGSGSGVYGLWEEGEVRDRALGALRERHPDCSWIPARFLTSERMKSRNGGTGRHDPSISWGRDS